MRFFYKAIFVTIIITSGALNSWAQAYRYALKFNYGIFRYNNEFSESISRIDDKPFSLGLQFQSNLNRAFSNSIGYNFYQWKNNGLSLSSYSVQDILFLRNNAKLLNRLKPQIGVGVGFEERKTISNQSKNYQQFMFVPLNAGFQIDLFERLALGVFGELRYGFNLDNFSISNSAIMPNNTAGLSIAYRFAKVKPEIRYPEVNWSANSNEIITLDNLYDYQKSLITKDTVVIANGHTLSVKNDKHPEVDSLSTESLASKISRVEPYKVVDTIWTSKTQEPDSVKLLDVKVSNGTGKNEPKFKVVNYSDSLNYVPSFKLTDFNPDVRLRDTIYLKSMNSLNNSENLSASVPPASQGNEVANYYYTQSPVPTNSVQISPGSSGLNTGLQVAETGSSVALNAQMAKLIDMQSQILLLLNKQNQSPFLQTENLKQIDSLKLRIANLENRLTKVQNMNDNLIEAPSKSVKTEEAVNKAYCVVTYAVNKTDLSDTQRNIIISYVFKDYVLGNKKITIESYTDASGSAAYNKKLSDQRLQKAVQFLLALGVNVDDIITKSYGETKASDQQNPEERRLVIKTIPKEEYGK